MKTYTILLLVCTLVTLKVSMAIDASETCRDRYGTVDVSTFSLRSCTMCYKYLFPKDQLFNLGSNYLSLVPRNKPLNGLTGPIYPNPENNTVLDMVCATFDNKADQCHRWRSCCKAAVDCCKRQLSMPGHPGKAGCERTWDGFSCWEDTPADTLMEAYCPAYMEHSIPTRIATKYCTSNETWYKKEQFEWTDYGACYDKQVRMATDASETCRDRFGTVDVSTFSLRSCTMCYKYLFPDDQLFNLGFHYLSLVPKNKTLHGFTGPIYPNPENNTVLDMVCATFDNKADQCHRWRSCCKAAVDCCKRQLSMPRHPGKAGCERTWDGFSCWEDTPADTVVETYCPVYMEHSIPTRIATKSCTSNETWYKKKQYEWTDYRACLDKEGYLIGVYICVAFNAVSISLLLPAIIIFAIYRDLYRQQRVRLHLHFCAALILKSFIAILWYMLVHYEVLVNPLPTESVVSKNPVWCRILSFLKMYFTSTTYFWMFCEGYFLHRLISNAFDTLRTLNWLYVTGWGLPMIPGLIYAIIRGALKNDSCWSKNFENFEWLIYTPNLLCLVANLVFLCNILRILLFQLHSHADEPSNFRRGLKAAFMLIPLFGLQLFLTIYRPAPGAVGKQEYEYITYFVTSSQGIFVALLFCFFNGEVLANLKRTCLPLSWQKQQGYSTHMTMITHTDNQPSPTASMDERHSPSNGHLLNPDHGRNHENYTNSQITSETRLNSTMQ